jgi:hypothetical protein
MLRTLQVKAPIKKQQITLHNKIKQSGTKKGLIMGFQCEWFESLMLTVHFKQSHTAILLPPPVEEPIKPPQPSPPPPVTSLPHTQTDLLPKRFHYATQIPCRPGNDSLFWCVELAMYGENGLIDEPREMKRKMNIVTTLLGGNAMKESIRAQWMQPTASVKMTFVEFSSKLSFLGSSQAINESVLPVLAMHYQRNIVVFDDYRYCWIRPATILEETEKNTICIYRANKYAYSLCLYLSVSTLQTTHVPMHRFYRLLNAMSKYKRPELESLYNQFIPQPTSPHYQTFEKKEDLYEYLDSTFSWQ